MEIVRTKKEAMTIIKCIDEEYYCSVWFRVLFLKNNNHTETNKSSVTNTSFANKNYTSSSLNWWIFEYDWVQYLSVWWAVQIWSYYLRVAWLYWENWYSSSVRWTSTSWTLLYLIMIHEK